MNENIFKTGESDLKLDKKADFILKKLNLPKEIFKIPKKN